MVINTIALYRQLHKELVSMRNTESQIRSRLSGITKESDLAVSKLHHSAQKTFADIDTTISDIGIYMTAALQYTSCSQYNPVPEHVQFAVLQQLYTMLDSSPEGRECAVKLYKKSANLIKYHENEKAKLQKSLKEQETTLRHQAISGPEVSRLKQELSQIKQKFTQIATGPRMQQLAAEIRKRSEYFFTDPKKICAPAIPKITSDSLCFGFTFLPFDMGQEFVKMLQSVLGTFYSANDRTILIPVCFPAEIIGTKGTYQAAKLSIEYSDSMLASSHLIMQALLFNIMRHYIPLTNRVTYVDLETFNPEYLGCMKQFIGNDGFIHFPSDEKQAISALHNLQSAASSEPEKKRHRRYLIVRGYFSGSIYGDFSTTLRRICNNTEKNNICVIFLDRMTSKQTTDAAKDLNITLRITGKDNHFVSDQFYPGARFGWLAPPGGIEQKAANAFRAAYMPKPITNEYEAFYSLSGKISYTRQRRDIEIPYGIDSRGNIQRLTFEGMNFASFVMGASGSGKSTLLHAILTGIIRNYHPDEVELWLADFKMTEFSQYLKHMPPHIRYILMDDAPELVHDFIDLMHEEMLRREALLASIGGDRKNVSLNQYLPAAFVIIDEFSILADVIKHDDTYKVRLQQLLTKGRQLGFRFIFASQKFTSGAAALTDQSKDQIGSRIVMKSTIDEMKATLELPAGQNTDLITRNIETLPKYYTLHKIQESDGTYRVVKALTLYFPGKDGAEWKSRHDLFDRLRKGMRAVKVSQYDPHILAQYVDKHPVTVSRKDLSVFNTKQFCDGINQYKADPQNMVFDGDLFVRFGKPRKLSDKLYTTLTSEPGENIFLLINEKETSCGMSVILSAACSVLAQKGTVQVWAHPKNRVYHQYRNSHFAKLQVSEGTDAIKNAIDHLRQRIQAKKHRPELIILLGMENVLRNLSDTKDAFEELGGSAAPVVDLTGLQATTAEEKELARRVEEDEAELAEIMDKFYEEGEAQGKTEEEMNKEFDEIIMPEFYRKKYGDAFVCNIPTPTPTTQPKPAESPAAARNYEKDFRLLLQLGSEMGCHFLVCVNSYLSFQRLGLKMEVLFNHRLSFKADSKDTFSTIFGSTTGYDLPEHVCYYGAFGYSGDRYSFTPYLHKGVTWDNWIVDADGNAKNLGTVTKVH